jgi:predicted RNA-binding Zn-ribbon protein involved in translation (DUF1610 family)
MTDFILKCSVCRALLDEEDEFCVNCGTEAPCLAEQSHVRQTQVSTHNFKCENCGASMSYDASVKNLRCPFCGSEKMHAEEDAKTLAPEKVIPFAIDERQALAELTKFMGNSFWRPSDLRETSQVTKLVAVYVPYWVFAASTYTYWTADSSHTPPGARASWYPVSGANAAHYQGVLVGASGALTSAETLAICPFDLAQGVPAEQIDLENALYEPFRVQKKYARPQAIAGFEELERNACRVKVPGNTRNLHVAVRLEGLASYPMLLPVWIMAYQYRGETYRFLVNGQTGRSTGHAPFSYNKLAAVIGGTLVVALLLFLIIAICSGLASGR